MARWRMLKILASLGLSATMQDIHVYLPRAVVDLPVSCLICVTPTRTRETLLIHGLLDAVDFMRLTVEPCLVRSL